MIWLLDHSISYLFPVFINFFMTSSSDKMAEAVKAQFEEEVAKMKQLEKGTVHQGNTVE